MKSYALFLLAAGLGSGLANAQPFTVYGPTAPSTRVSYADLNLASDEGVDRLKARIRHAASGLCRSESLEPLSITAVRRNCYRTAVDGAFAKVDQLISDRMAGKASLISATIIVSVR